jgi:hypothetical protein
MKTEIDGPGKYILKSSGRKIDIVEKDGRLGVDMNLLGYFLPVSDFTDRKRRYADDGSVTVNNSTWEEEIR